MTKMWYGGPLLKCIDINKNKQNLVIEHTNGNTETTQTEDKALSVINVSANLNVSTMKLPQVKCSIMTHVE